MRDVANLLAVITVCHESANFEDELRVAEVHDANLSVRGLALIVVAESAAHAQDSLGIGSTLAVSHQGISQRAISIS